MGTGTYWCHFSSRAIVKPFTSNRIELEDTVMTHQNEGTVFPIEAVKNVVGKRSGILIIVISDAAIYNDEEAKNFLLSLASNNDVYFIHIDKPREGTKKFLYGISRGVRIIRIEDISELPKTVLNIVSRNIIIE